MSRPEWLTVGADVVEFTPSRQGPGGRIKRAVITKIGKRDVVLDNGSRFNVNRLRRDANSTWDPSSLLLSPSDPLVLRAARANGKQASYLAASEACRALGAVIDSQRSAVGRDLTVTDAGRRKLDDALDTVLAAIMALS